MESHLNSHKRNYYSIFDQLSYVNKGVLNEIADYLEQKKLNRLANKRILSEIAEMVLDCQERALPLDHLFGADRAAFCDRLSKKAPVARLTEKILALVRNLSALFLLVGLIALGVSFVGGGTLHLGGIRALQIMGGTLVALFFFPLVCYRDALYITQHPIVPISKNMIDPDANRIDIKSLLLRVLYSLVCAAGTIAYMVFCWIYPEILMKSRLNAIELNALVWVMISAAVFIVSHVGEIYIVRRNCKANGIK